MISDVGLVLHPLYPFPGATPDGVVSCSCHGDGEMSMQNDINWLQKRTQFFVVQAFKVKGDTPIILLPGADAKETL